MDVGKHIFIGLRGNEQMFEDLEPRLSDGFLPEAVALGSDGFVGMFVVDGANPSGGNQFEANIARGKGGIED